MKAKLAAISIVLNVALVSTAEVIVYPEIEMPLNTGSGRVAPMDNPRSITALLPGENAQLLQYRTDDLGQTWNGPDEIQFPFGNTVNTYQNVVVARDRAASIAVAWQGTYYPPSQHAGDTFYSAIMVNLSHDSGRNWLGAVEIIVDQGETDSQFNRPVEDPVISTDDTGVWVVAWNSEWRDLSYDDDYGTYYIYTGGGVAVSASLDHGESWTAPITVASPNTSRSNEDVSLASLGGGAWELVWSSRDPSGGEYGRDRDIFRARSEDDGRTWTAPQTVFTDASTDHVEDFNPTLLVEDRGSTIYLFWEEFDIESTVRRALLSRFDETMSALSEPLSFPFYDAGVLGLDAAVQMEAFGTGKLLAVFASNDWLQECNGPDYDVFHTVSSDFGVTWSAPRLVSNDVEFSWTDSLVDMVRIDEKSVYVATQPSGRIDGNFEYGDGLLYTLEIEGEWNASYEKSAGESYSADYSGDGTISLSELLRVAQLYNAGRYVCNSCSEDGYQPGENGGIDCEPHDADVSPRDWQIGLSELLRVIQFYNSLEFHYCGIESPEDGYCLGGSTLR